MVALLVLLLPLSVLLLLFFFFFFFLILAMSSSPSTLSLISGSSKLEWNGRLFFFLLRFGVLGVIPRSCPWVKIRGRAKLIEFVVAVVGLALVVLSFNLNTGHRNRTLALTVSYNSPPPIRSDQILIFFAKMAEAFDLVYFCAPVLITSKSGKNSRITTKISPKNEGTYSTVWPLQYDHILMVSIVAYGS